MKNMLGLGLDRGLQKKAKSLTQWTATTVGPLTSPTLSLSGAQRNTIVTVYIDNANDWTGTLSDYTMTNFTIVNETDSVTHNQGSDTFASNTTLLTLRALQKTGYNLQTLVGAGSGKTIRFTFDLTLSGYEDVTLTSTITF
jgi:hypothetical protein|tara:strand:+ start:71 stop:493 length:423 start_codon:yes stop_codon:yes gene_type:complete